jgi:hypothetical protein
MSNTEEPGIVLGQQFQQASLGSADVFISHALGVVCPILSEIEAL